MNVPSAATVRVHEMNVAPNSQHVPGNIVSLLQNIYTISKSAVHVGDAVIDINIEKGVRRGDTISLRLFTACPHHVLNALNWYNKEVNVDGCFLSHLAFTRRRRRRLAQL